MSAFSVGAKRVERGTGTFIEISKKFICLSVYSVHTKYGVRLGPLSAMPTQPVKSYRVLREQMSSGSLFCTVVHYLPYIPMYLYINRTDMDMGHSAFHTIVLCILHVNHQIASVVKEISAICILCLQDSHLQPKLLHSTCVRGAT